MTLDGRIAQITPEGVRLFMTPAGPAIRGFAWAIDFIACMAAVWATSMLLGWLMPATHMSHGLLLLVIFVVYWAYPVLCEVYAGGATLGKRAAGLVVVRDDGLPVGWRESALRNLLVWADFLPALYVTGLLSMMCDGRFRRIGDLAAGTLVIYRDRPVDRRLPLPQDGALPPPWPLTVAEQRALADLFARAGTLPEARLLELATLAEPLTGRTGAASLARLRAIAAGIAR